MNITLKQQDGTSQRLSSSDPRYGVALASINNAKQLLLHFYLRSLFAVFTVLAGITAIASHAVILFIASVLFGAIAIYSGVRYQQARRRMPVLANAFRGLTK